MGTLTKIKKPVRKVAKSPPSAPKVKFPEGHPFAGIESAFGSVSIPVPPPARIPMKDADFQNLLQGVREAGSYLRGNKKATARIDHIDPEP